MTFRLVLLSWAACAAAFLSQPAAAQDPACRVQLNRALAAPRAQQQRLLNGVLSNCPRDRVAAVARQRIRELTQPATRSTDTGSRRQGRAAPPPPPPQRRADQPPPPPRAPAATARGVTVTNFCPYTLRIRLIYQTGQGWLYEEWEIGSGNQDNLLDMANQSLRVISDEIYYTATGPNGPLVTDETRPYEFEGQTLYITPAIVTLNDAGNYQLTMSCSDEVEAPTPPPTPPADSSGRRYISFENGCSHGIRIYVSHADGDRNWHEHGPFEIPANQGPTRLEANGITLTQSANHELYFYAESLDGSGGVWNGTDHVVAYNGVTYQMRRAEVDVIENGWLNARLTCGQ